MIDQLFAAGGALQVVTACFPLTCFSLTEQFVPPTLDSSLGCHVTEAIRMRGRPCAPRSCDAAAARTKPDS
jgi:hypothetical protein